MLAQLFGRRVEGRGVAKASVATRVPPLLVWNFLKELSDEDAELKRALQQEG